MVPLEDYHLRKWSNFVARFMSKYNLWPGGGTAWVAVSGGRDSILLLWTLHTLLRKGRLRDLKVLHFNHQTRPECEEEETLVVRYSRHLELPVEVGYPTTRLLGRSNAEHMAREERYAFFKRMICPGDKVYLAHHLDDSLEWSLMSRFKSGRLRPQLGIPVINGAFARPFLCVTREQIERMTKRLELNWLEDSSNQDLRFERNFLRSRILSAVKQRFPGYMRHYVTSSNHLARKLGVWRGGNEYPFEERSLPLGGVGLFHSRLENKFWGAEEQIRNIVEKLSLGNRGSISTQINKMIEAAARGKQGPIFFSGSVRGYMASGVLFFVRLCDLGEWERYDCAIVRALEKGEGLEGFPFRSMGRWELLQHISRMPFPPMGVENDAGKQKMEGAHFLLPQAALLFKKRGWRLNSLVRMARGMKKDGETGQILPLDLLAQMGDFDCVEGV